MVENPLIFLQNPSSEPAGTRPELLRAPVGLIRAPAEASWAQKSHFRPMADGLGHVGVGTPCFLHTFQRRSNRAPAIILEESTDRIETVVKGKSFMPPNSIESKGAANNSGPQSETSRFCNGKSKDLDSRPAGIPSHFFKILHPDWPRLGQSSSEPRAGLIRALAEAKREPCNGGSIPRTPITGFDRLWKVWRKHGVPTPTCPRPSAIGRK